MNKKEFRCEPCGKSFKTAAAKGSHDYITHGVKGTSRDATRRKKLKKGAARASSSAGREQAAVSLDEAIAALQVEVDARLGVIERLKEMRKAG